MKRTTLSFLTESKASHVSLSSFRRVAITLLVMLLTTASAIAENSYWLTLDDNYEGGASTMIPISIYDNTITLTEKLVPTRAGEHTFWGWSTSSTGDVEYKTGDKVTLDGNLTLYAVWEETSYTLTLDANYEDGVSTIISVPFLSPTHTLTRSDVPTREGHIFKGWSQAPTGYIQYEANDIVKLSGNLTLYALWDDSPNLYKLKFSITSENIKQVKLSGYEGDKPKGTLNIPATVTINGTEYSVTSIGYYAFSECSDLQSVTIPNSVTRIGASAFHNCSNLQSVTIPESVTTIEEQAFEACFNLQSVTIPNSVTSIGFGAFYSCSNLQSVTISESVTNIEERTFSDCSSLQSVTIPNSVTSIGNQAFFDCDNLQSVTINGNPKIGDEAFVGTPATVTMNLTASEIDGDYWTTFYNYAYDDYGYNFQADENTKVYKGMVEGSSLMLTEVEDKIVNSGTAVILKSSGKPVMTLTGSGSSDTNSNSLRGIRDRTSLAEVKSANNANTIYTLGNTSAGFGFHRYTGAYVPEGKAFLPLDTSDGAKAQSLTIVFAIGATGINSVSSDSNVQNDWFSLDGTRLSGKPSQPGIYVNGKKKVVIK